MRRRDVADWPITTFRCVAEFGRYRGNIGLSPAERPEDLWVHGLAGPDPVEQQTRAIEKEMRDVQAANQLGLSRREYTRRKALGNDLCSQVGELRE